MKKILFGVFATILSLGMVHARAITNLGIDTPVRWPVVAVNETILDVCDLRKDVTAVSSTKIGHFDGRYGESKVEDLEAKCANFVSAYVNKYKASEDGVSLREILDMCMSTLNNKSRCAYMAQLLIYHSSSNGVQKLTDSTVTSSMAGVRLTSNGFYVFGKMKLNKGIPHLEDINLYQDSDNRIVGECPGEPDMMTKSIACEMMPEYTYWACNVMVAEGVLYCSDEYEAGKEHMIYVIDNDMKRVNNKMQSLRKGSYRDETLICLDNLHEYLKYLKTEIKQEFKPKSELYEIMLKYTNDYVSEAIEMCNEAEYEHLKPWDVL